MAKTLRKKDKELLTAIEQAMSTKPGFILVPEGDDNLERLKELGLVTVDEDNMDGEGNVPVRLAENAEVPNDNENENEEKGFELETGIVVPAVQRRGRRKSKYPFDEMEVGHSFHVPKSEKMENPAKSMASVVTAANGRFVVDGKRTRKYIVRRVDSTDPKGEGARVFRIALED